MISSATTQARPRTKLWARAQAATELALLAPVLVLVLIVCADSMRLYYAAIAVSGAAQAAAAFAAQSPISAADLNGIRQAALNNLSHVNDLDLKATNLCSCGLGVLTPCARTPRCAGLRGYVRVEAAATFHALIHYPGLGGSLRLRSVALRRVE